MLYKVEISELLEPATGEKYPSEIKIYEQRIANLEIDKIVSYLNTSFK